jgi:hypothetical protein
MNVEICAEGDLLLCRQRAQIHPWFTNSAPIYRARDPERPADPPLSLFNA